MSIDWIEDDIEISPERLSDAKEAEFLGAWDAFGIEPKEWEMSDGGRASKSAQKIQMMKSCVDAGLIGSKRVAVVQHGEERLICRRADLNEAGEPDVGTFCLVPRECAYGFFLDAMKTDCVTWLDAAKALIKAAEDALSKVVHADEDPYRRGMIRVHVDAADTEGNIAIDALFKSVRFMGEGEICEAYAFRRAVLRPHARAKLRELCTEVLPVAAVLEAESIRAYDAGIERFCFPVPLRGAFDPSACLEVEVPVKDWFDLPEPVSWEMPEATEEEGKVEETDLARKPAEEVPERLTPRQIGWLIR